MKVETNPKDSIVRVYTHNIRYATESPFKGEKFWNDRRDLVISSILFNTELTSPAVVCLQEVLYEQLLDIQKGLGDDWTYIGVAREDGDKKGEFNPIFYKKADWTLVDSHTTWLSDTPDKPSKGWDGGSYRILEWGLFQSKADDRIKLNVFNTHLDDQGKVARREAANIIVHEYEEKVKTAPLVLTGDFNSPPEDEAYQIVDKHLTDTYLTVKGPQQYGHLNTYSGFDSTKLDLIRIDYIWASDKVKTLRSGVLHSEFQGTFMSDHRPVVTDIRI